MVLQQDEAFEDEEPPEGTEPQGTSDAKNLRWVKEDIDNEHLPFEDGFAVPTHVGSTIEYFGVFFLMK